MTQSLINDTAFTKRVILNLDTLHARDVAKLIISGCWSYQILLDLLVQLLLNDISGSAFIKTRNFLSCVRNFAINAKTNGVAREQWFHLIRHV